MVFYTILFAGMAVLLVVAGITVVTRNRRQLDAERGHETAAANARRRERNARRAQSRRARRKRG